MKRIKLIGMDFFMIFICLMNLLNASITKIKIDHQCDKCENLKQQIYELEKLNQNLEQENEQLKQAMGSSLDDLNYSIFDEDDFISEEKEEIETCIECQQFKIKLTQLKELKKKLEMENKKLKNKTYLEEKSTKIENDTSLKENNPLKLIVKYWHLKHHLLPFLDRELNTNLRTLNKYFESQFVKPKYISLNNLWHLARFESQFKILEIKEDPANNDTSDHLVSSNMTFVVLKRDGNSIAWGWNFLIPIPDATNYRVYEQNQVVNVFVNEEAFTKLKMQNGLNFDDYFFGNYDFFKNKQNDPRIMLQKIISNGSASAALSKDGSVETWGNPDFGGDITRLENELANGVVNLFKNRRSFAALKEDGSVIAWGKSPFGDKIYIFWKNI